MEKSNSPILDESVEFEILEKDLEIILPPPQGNVNRAAVWVQVFHLPTGITVFCNNEYKQLQNQDLRSVTNFLAFLSKVNSQQSKNLDFDH